MLVFRTVFEKSSRERSTNSSSSRDDAIVGLFIFLYACLHLFFPSARALPLSWEETAFQHFSEAPVLSTECVPVSPCLISHCCRRNKPSMGHRFSFLPSQDLTFQKGTFVMWNSYFSTGCWTYSCLIGHLKARSMWMGYFMSKHLLKETAFHEVLSMNYTVSF